MQVTECGNEQCEPRVGQPGLGVTSEEAPSPTQRVGLGERHGLLHQENGRDGDGEEDCGGGEGADV